MELTDEELNLALAAFLIWGPAMAIPTEQRMITAVPRLTTATAVALAARFQKFSSGASAIVSDGLRTKVDESTMRARVAALDPQLSADNAAMLFTQARVGAWRDGEG